jgi:hypothetical protein
VIKYSKTVKIADLLVIYSRFICNLVVIFAIYLRCFNGRGHDLFAVFAIHSRFLRFIRGVLTSSRFLRFFRAFCDLFVVFVIYSRFSRFT